MDKQKEQLLKDKLAELKAEIAKRNNSTRTETVKYVKDTNPIKEFLAYTNPLAWGLGIPFGFLVGTFTILKRLFAKGLWQEVVANIRSMNPMEK